MNINQKITWYLLVFLAITAAIFFFLAPMFESNLYSLQGKYQDQENQLSALTAQASSLRQIQDDFSKINQMSVKPVDLFSTDVSLVEQFKYIENLATVTNVNLELAITGTADNAQSIKNVKSKLITIPYTIKVQGNFPNIINFIKNFENSYFISPISGLAITKDTTGLGATILSNVYLRQQ